MHTYMNVRINSKDLADKDFVNQVLAEGAAIVKRTQELEQEVIAIVESKM